MLVWNIRISLFSLISGIKKRKILVLCPESRIEDAEKYLKSFQERGYINRDGADKNGIWRVIK